jgi:hypothetical protein
MLFVHGARAGGVPTTKALSYAGYLETAAGEPVNGNRSIGIAIYDAQIEGQSVCGLNEDTVPVTNGRFALALPDKCASAVAANPNLWVELTIAGTSLGRSQLGAVPYSLEASHASNSDAASQCEVATHAEDGVPIGTIAPFAGLAVPVGWFLCDGTSLERRKYPALFGAIGASWGTVDSGHFNLPDLRGRFLRGADGGAERDPDRNTRSPSNPGGASGDAVGTIQTDAFRSHNHGGLTGNATRDRGGFTSYADYASSGPLGPALSYASQPGATGSLYEHQHTIASDGAAETRPTNASVIWIIRADP